MTSRKIIDIANSLDFVNDYNNSGITGNNSRISTSEYGQLFLYSTNSSVNSSTATIVLYNGGISINNTNDATSITSGGSLTIRGGASFEKSIRVGNSGYITNVISTNSSISTLNVTGLTAGNINFTGDLYKNGSLYVSSQWTSSSGTLSYTNGNVGIATTSPNYTLDVNGTINSTNIISTNITTSVLNASGITSGNINFTGNLYKNGNIYISSQWKDEANGALSFTGGNIGIGNTSPDYKLDITGNLRVNSTDASIIISRNNNNVLQIQNSLISGNSSIQFADNSGNTKLFTGYANANSSIVSLAGSSYILSDTTVSLKLVAGNQTDIPVILNANDNSFSITTTTDASNIYSGALKVSGGAGIAKKLYVGDDLHVNRDLYVSGSINGAAASSSTYGYITLTATDDSINLSTGSLVTFGGITIQSTADSNSTSDGGSFLTAGGASIQKTLRVGNGIISENLSTTNISTNNINVLNLTTGNLRVNNLNLGISNMFSGSFTPNNNMVTLSNVDGLSFSNTDTRSFIVNLSVSIESSGGNLYETFVLDGTQNNSQWSLYTTSYGDNSGIIFSITNSGQIQYTSTNISGFTNSIFRFFVNQIANTGTYIYAGLQTQGTLIINDIQILSTADSNIGVNNGSLYLAGGATVSKTLYADNITSSNVKVTNITSNSIVGVNVNVTNSTITNAVHTTLSTGTLTANLISAGNAVLSASTGALILGSDTGGITPGINSAQLYIIGNRSSTINVAGIGFQRSFFRISSMGIDNTNNMSFALQNSADSFVFRNGSADFSQTTSGTTLLTILSSGGISTASVNVSGTISAGTILGSTLISAANVAASLITVGTLTGSTVNGTNSTITNAVHTALSTGTLTATTSVSSAALFATNASVGGLNASTGLTAASALITNNLLALGNSNTLGSLFTTAGNVGIGTAAPVTKLDVNGSIAISNIVGSAQMFLGNATTGNSRLNIRDSSNNHISFYSSTSTTGSITCSANGNPGMFLNGGGGISQLTLASTGNIGIGTSNPSEALHVEGNILIKTGGSLWITGNSDNSLNRLRLHNSGTFSYLDYGGVTPSLTIRSGSGTSGAMSNMISLSPSSITFNAPINGTNSTITNMVGTALSTGTLTATTSITTAALFATNITATNIVGTTISAGTLTSTNINGTNSTITNAVHTALSTGTLSVTTSVTSGGLFATNVTATNIVATTISAGTLVGTTITGGNLSLSGNLIVAGTLTTVNITSTNILNTNISIGTISATGLSSLANVTATNSSVGVLVASTGITTASILNTGLISSANLSSTTATIPNIIHTNISTGTISASSLSSLANVTATNASVGVLIASTGITAASAQITNIVGTTISAGTILGNISSANIAASIITAGTLNAATSVSSANVAASVITTGTLLSSSIILSGSSAQVSTYPLTNGLENGIAYFNNTLASADTTRWVVGLNVQTGVGNYGFWNSSLGRPALTMTSTGNIGISTTSPASRLTVVGSGSGGLIRTYPSSYNAETGFGFYSGESSGNYWVAGKGSWAVGAEKFAIGSSVYNNAVITLDTNGSVGIGTNSPQTKLHVNGAITIEGETVPAVSGTVDSSNLTQTYITFKPNGSSNDWAYLRQIGGSNEYLMALDIHDDGDEKGFCIRSITSTLTPDTINERFRVQANGNVGIGTSSPSVSLDVNGDVRGKSLLVSGSGTYTTGSIYSDSSYGMMYRSNTSNPILSHFAWSDYDDNKLLYLSSTGGSLICTGDVTAFGSLSDSRLKENISSISNDTALETVRLLRPVTFNWRDDIFNRSKRGTLDVGFIAQEVEQLIPLAVSEYDEINTGKVYKNIKHERLIPYLVGAIQRLDYENDRKQSEINNLSKQLNDLKNKLLDN